MSFFKKGGIIINQIGKNIMIYRKKCNLNQIELAKKVYVSKSTVSNWEKGNVEPKIYQLQDIAKALDCELSDLIESKVEVKKNKSNKGNYTQTIQYRRYKHEWNIIRNLMLAFVIASGITTVLLHSESWYTISLVSILVYAISTIIIGFVDVKNVGPSINYPIGEKLIFKHSNTEVNIKKFSSNHKTTIILQFFLIFLSFLSLVGTTNDKLTSNQIIYIVLLFLFLVGWTIFLFIESIIRSYIQKEVEYLRIRKNFGLGIFEFNLGLSLIYFISNLILYYSYNYEITDIQLNLFAIGIPGLYLLLTWSIHYGQSKFYAKFELYSYDSKTETYTCLEEVE